MKLIGINHISEEGERNVAAAIEYEQPVLAGSICTDVYQVQGRRLLGAYVSHRPEYAPGAPSCDGRYVILILDPEEAQAVTLPFEAQDRRILTYTVRQVKEVLRADHEVYQPWDKSLSVSQVRNPVTDKFQHWDYHDGKTGQTVSYSLYVPKEIQEDKKYPLVLYWHGGGEKGSNGLKSLLFSMNGTVWTLEEEQKKQPCYVLVPQCPLDTDWIDPDTYKLTDVFDTICNLLFMILHKEKVDWSRIYCLGFSMGGMGAWECTKRYPGLFAATMILAGQCNYEGLEILKDNRIWVFHGEDDDKAMSGNMDNIDTLQAAGAVINHGVWDGSLRGMEAQIQAESQIAKGGNILHTLYREGSIRAGWTHEAGWKPAVTNPAVRRWLLDQTNPAPSKESYSYITKAQLIPAQICLPFEGREIRQMAPGNRHTAALLKDGRVYAWGFQPLGTGGEEPEPVLVKGLPHDLEQIASGNNFSLALTREGQVYGWGKDTFGQLNGQDSEAVYEQAVLLKAKNIKAIEAGDNYALALDKDGTVWAWGANVNGQLGQGDYHSRRVPVRVKDKEDPGGYLTNICRIIAGVRTVIAVKLDGTIRCWGDSEYGQTGNERACHGPGIPLPVYSCDKADPSGKLTGVLEAAQGRCHTAVLKENRCVYTWGLNRHGELGLGDYRPAAGPEWDQNPDFLTTEVSPQKVDGLEDVVQLGAGMSHTVVLKENGTVWTWGYNDLMSRGVLGVGEVEASGVPVQVKGLEGIERIYVGLNHNYAIDKQGRVWAWGNAQNGRLGKITVRQEEGE